MISELLEGTRFTNSIINITSNDRKIWENVPIEMKNQTILDAEKIAKEG